MACCPVSSATILVERLRRERQPHDELAALPSPSLWASTVPPCISTRFFTSVRPMPSPPCDLRGGVVHLHEQLEDAGQHVRGDADAVVPHPQHRLVALPLGRQPDAPVRLGVLGGVGQQVADDLGEPHRVGVEQQGFGRKSDAQLVALGVDERLDRLHRTGDDRGQFDPLLAEFDLAPHDPGHVEQVVHQPDQVMDLPLHHLP